jgi:hypothetical protein
MDTLEARGVVAGFLLLATNVPISAVAKEKQTTGFSMASIMAQNNRRENGRFSQALYFSGHFQDSARPQRRWGALARH